MENRTRELILGKQHKLTPCMNSGFKTLAHVQFSYQTSFTNTNSKLKLFSISRWWLQIIKPYTQGPSEWWPYVTTLVTCSEVLLLIKLQPIPDTYESRLCWHSFQFLRKRQKYRFVCEIWLLNVGNKNYCYFYTNTMQSKRNPIMSVGLTGSQAQ